MVPSRMLDRKFHGFTGIWYLTYKSYRAAIYYGCLRVDYLTVLSELQRADHGYWLLQFAVK